MILSSLVLVTPPIGEPISLVEAKAFAKIASGTDDELINSLITTARLHWDGKDGWFGRALLTQTWDLLLPRFPWEWDEPVRDCLYGIRVPLPPLQSVTSISYVDSDGAPQTLASSEYVVDTKAEPGRVVPAYGKSWPSTRETVNAVTVRFVAGYGAASAVPKDIRDWLKQAVAYLFERREAPELPQAFFWSMARYKASWGF
jgi:uncharacterized phiE125 gp8 family phage protein